MVSSSVLSGTWTWHWGMMPYGHGWGLDGWCMGGFVMWIFFLLAISIMIYLFMKNIGKAAQGPGKETPLDIAKRRYAQGEITRQQYEDMKRDLES